MGFSLRNVVDIDAGLARDLARARPGARFVNLDVSKAPNRLFKRCFDLYFYDVVPLVGRNRRRLARRPTRICRIRSRTIPMPTTCASASRAPDSPMPATRG